ncbi:MAG: ATP-binding protein [Candidatus Zixiibacteriota bacterium]
MVINDTKVHTVELPSDISVKVLGEFENKILDLVEHKPHLVSIDCSNLGQATSSHVNALWLAYLYCKDAGIEVCISSPTEQLVRVLKLLDLHELFTFDDDTIRTRMRKVVRSISSENISTYADEFPADSENINAAMERFRQYLNGLNIDKAIAIELGTVFYEVATNIRLHSGIKEGELIVFTSRMNDERLTLVFADSGKPFDLTKRVASFVPEHAARSRQSRGFGLEMIHRMTDGLSYRRLHDSINVLTIEKGIK